MSFLFQKGGQNKVQKVLAKLSNDMDSKNINRSKMVKKLNIDSATLSRFLKGKHQLSFHKYGEMLKEVYPDEIYIRREFCSRYSKCITRPGNKRMTMYYLLSHGELNILNELIESEKKSKHHEWATICELICLRYQGELSGDELLKEYQEKTESFKTNTLEMDILRGIVLLHIRYDQKNYKSMVRLSKELHQKSEDLKDGYTKDFLKFKIQEAIIYGLLTCSEIEELRRVCYEIINDEYSEKYFPIFRATAYGVLGESYVFTNYSKSLACLQEAIRIIDKGPKEQMNKRRNMILNTIDFLKIHWKVDLHNINPVEKVESAYLEIQKGNNEKAIQILNEILNEQGYLSAFGLTYLGIAKGNDQEILCKALDLFERNSNIFYSYLPKKYLGIIPQKCYNLVG